MRFNKNHSLWPLPTQSSAPSNIIMGANVLPHNLCSSSSKLTTLLLISNQQHSPFTNQISFPTARSRLPSLKATTNDNTSSGDNGNTPPPPDTPSQQKVGVRFRNVSRRMSKKKELDASEVSRKKPAPPKDWESMTIPEKAVELYMGEKGLLFWLNKFAYASIFITIGAWILFRFVGPSLGLYQLDTPPLSPTSILK